MRLRDLDVELLTYVNGKEFRTDATSVAEASGVWFLCPKCYAANGGDVGTHRVLCWFAGRGVPDHIDPKPGRWNPSGTNIDDLTFVGPGAVSVLLTSGCGWHGFVRQGDAS